MKLRKFVIVCATCAVVYAAAAVGLYAAMRQPPETFGAIMKRVPTVAMMVLPFKPLWMSARAGHLQIGDRAPDFSLRPLHGEGNAAGRAEFITRILLVCSEAAAELVGLGLSRLLGRSPRHKKDRPLEPNADRRSQRERVFRVDCRCRYSDRNRQQEHEAEGAQLYPFPI